MYEYSLDVLAVYKSAKRQELTTAFGTHMILDVKV